MACHRSIYLSRSADSAFGTRTNRAAARGRFSVCKGPPLIDPENAGNVSGQERESLIVEQPFWTIFDALVLTGPKLGTDVRWALEAAVEWLRIK